MRRRELPREAFLGEMVIGHKKKSKVIKNPFPQASCENIRENRGYSGKMCVNCVQSIVNMFYFNFSSEL